MKKIVLPYKKLFNTLYPESYNKNTLKIHLFLSFSTLTIKQNSNTEFVISIDDKNNSENTLFSEFPKTIRISRSDLDCVEHHIKEKFLDPNSLITIQTQDRRNYKENTLRKKTQTRYLSSNSF